MRRTNRSTVSVEAAHSIVTFVFRGKILRGASGLIKKRRDVYARDFINQLDNHMAALAGDVTSSGSLSVYPRRYQNTWKSYLLLASSWMALLCCVSWLIICRFCWSVSWDISPSTVTFVYWLLTGGGWLLLFLSPLDDLLKKFLQKNSLAPVSFFTTTTFALPSLLFVSFWATCSHADDPAWVSIFFMVIVITKFGFTSLVSWGLPSSMSIKRFSLDELSAVPGELFCLEAVIGRKGKIKYFSPRPFVFTFKWKLRRSAASHSPFHTPNIKHFLARDLFLWRNTILGKVSVSTVPIIIFSLLSVGDKSRKAIPWKTPHGNSC